MTVSNVVHQYLPHLARARERMTRQWSEVIFQGGPSATRLTLMLPATAPGARDNVEAVRIPSGGGLPSHLLFYQGNKPGVLGPLTARLIGPAGYRLSGVKYDINNQVSNGVPGELRRLTYPERLREEPFEVFTSNSYVILNDGTQVTKDYSDTLTTPEIKKEIEEWDTLYQRAAKEKALTPFDFEEWRDRANRYRRDFIPTQYLIKSYTRFD